MNKLVGFIVLGSLLFTTQWATPEESVEKRTFIFGYVEFHPFYYTDETGNAAGPMIKMVKAIAEVVGLNIKTLSVPPKRAVRLVASGDVDLWFGLATNESYNKHVYISKEPMDKLELRVYSLNPMESFKDKSSLLGSTVVVERGYTYGGLTDYIEEPLNNVEVMRVSDLDQAFRVLTKRKFDYLIAYARSADKALKDFPGLEVHSRVLYHFPIHITLHKEVDGAVEIMNKIENARKKLFPTVESIYH